MCALQADVLDWGATHRRDLPWRRTRDRWAVLVAELMLHQTQVARVVPKWEDFVAAYPTPAACAAASLADVLTRWQGLGYPRRARALWLAAQHCVDRHDGQLPDNLEHLLALPGVGPYTARAVLVFADERPVGVVDTNIARILARVTGTRLTPNAAQAVADGWVPPEQAWAWNQTLMDVGAMKCRPVPACDGCPLADHCTWRIAGRPEPDPAQRSAYVSSRQPRFEGSDRQARGRLLAALATGALHSEQVAEAAGLADDPQRADRLVAGLVEEGLATHSGGRYHLG